MIDPLCLFDRTLVCCRPGAVRAEERVPEAAVVIFPMDEATTEAPQALSAWTGEPSPTPPGDFEEWRAPACRLLPRAAECRPRRGFLRGAGLEAS